MKFTKEQLRVMRDVGVPVEMWECGKWVEPEWHLGFGAPADEYRPRPGYTFGGSTAKQLDKAGVPVEHTWEHHEYWTPVKVFAGWGWPDSMFGRGIKYRISTAEPEQADNSAKWMVTSEEHERVREERDTLRELHRLDIEQHQRLTQERDEWKAKAEKWRGEFDLAAKDNERLEKERDGLRDDVSLVVKRRDKLRGAIENALTTLEEAL